MDLIEFSLPFALPSLNIRDRQHWGKRRKYKSDLWLSVVAAIGGPRYFPLEAFPMARVTVNRSSSKALDPDNLVASVKPLADVLRPRLIRDDSPKHIELVVTQSSAAPGHGATTVRIERLDRIGGV